MCTKMTIQVELQEDDMSGQLPDSEMTFPAGAALTSKWVDTPFINTNRSQVIIEKTFSHWTPIFNHHYLKGVFVDWEGMVLNNECVTDTRIIVTRLVKGRLSDTTKRVVVPVPLGRENFTLVLLCEDTLPYNIQVGLYTFFEKYTGKGVLRLSWWRSSRLMEGRKDLLREVRSSVFLLCVPGLNLDMETLPEQSILG